MFKYDKDYYDVKDGEDREFYNVLFSKIFSIFSPFEVDDNVDFPNKDKLGGVVLKFIGGGAAFFKVQREMPTDEEINSILEVCEFLKESFGEYVISYILCEPHVEIRDIEVPDKTTFDVTFVSSRKNDGDKVLKRLSRKIKKDECFSKEDFILKLVVPYMYRKDDDKFQKDYCDFVELYNNSGLVMPKDLSKANIGFRHIF